MIQVAIVGCGVIGPVHAAAVRLDAGAAIRWACDSDAAKLPRVAAQHATTDVAEVLRDPAVDLVCICTQHPAHADIAVAALAAGKHIVCEKPLGSTPADVARILRAAEAAPGQVAAGIFQHRHVPLARRIRQMIGDGALGAVRDVEIAFACTRDQAYYASGAWRGTREGEGGGVAINQGIHTIDLGLWLAGAAAQRVDGRIARRRLDCIEVEDAFTAEVACAGGLRARIRCDNDGVTHWMQRIVIRGDRGSITLGDGHRLVAVDHVSTPLREELQAIDAGNAAARQLEGAKAVYGDQHAHQIADVLESIRAGRRPMVTVADAAAANLVVLAAYHSSGSARPVELPLDPSSYRFPHLPLEKA